MMNSEFREVRQVWGRERTPESTVSVIEYCEKHIFYRQSCWLKASRARERTLPGSFNQTDSVSQGEVSSQVHTATLGVHVVALHTAARVSKRFEQWRKMKMDEFVIFRPFSPSQEAAERWLALFFDFAQWLSSGAAPSTGWMKYF